MGIEFSNKILILGASGMVGGAVVRRLRGEGFNNLLEPVYEDGDLDCLNQQSVADYLQYHKPDMIFIAAAMVGGIYANKTYPADFAYKNLMIVANLIHQAHLADVNQIFFLGSTCIYPKLAPQPLKEECLLTGPLEPTNEAYALAKIMGVKLCEYYSTQYGRDYFAAMPTNMYGPGDNYHPENSHVLAALLKRFHDAKEAGASEVTIWGTGKVQREFLYVEDTAEACVFIMKQDKRPRLFNIGSEEEVTILELAHIIADVVGFEGEILHDLSKPDGTPRKKTDTSCLASIGWHAKTKLREGIAKTYQLFLSEEILRV
jgi:GDP-L-fucose synthase